MDIQRILVVDDSRVTLHLVRAVLEDAYYEVWTAVSGEEALDLIKKKGLPHLAIVDINMPPGMDGFTFCRKVHQFCDLPIVMLSAEEDEETVVKGLDHFAEDYVVKPHDGPIRSEELVSRVRRVLRRIGDFAYRLEPVTRIDDYLQVDFAGRTAIVAGETVRLTPTESKLLYLLVRHAGRTLTNEYLIQRMWPLEEAFEDRLHTHVYRLRKKIEPDSKVPAYIVSAWGKGYEFPAMEAA